MTFEKIEDKRHFHRIFYNGDVSLAGDGVKLGCKIVDLSLKGCLLEFDQPWVGALEALYTLTLVLSEEISIVMELTAVHTEGKRAGFQCRHIDIDSISNLRRLVELNLGNSDLLERELASLREPTE